MSKTSKKRRVAKKKTQMRAAHKEKANKPLFYDGFMKVPLDSGLEPHEVKRRTEYDGDWINPAIREEILGSPRKFKVTAHITDSKGEKAVATIDYQGYGSRNTIADASIVAFDAAREKKGDIVMRRSYIVVRARKDGSKAPKEVDIEALQASKRKAIMGLANPMMWGGR